MACSQVWNGAIAARLQRATPLVSVLALALAVGVASTAVPARASGAGHPHRTRVALVAQTIWVTGSSMSLEVAIRSSLPETDLGLKLTVYSRLTSRYAFDLSESGKQAPSELVLDSTPIIPLRSLAVSGTSTLDVEMHVRVATSASAGPGPLGFPGLALDCAPLACDGVYPLDVTVVDTSDNTLLKSFTTFLIYVAGKPGSIPLRVALVLPFGAKPALDAAGASTLTGGEIESLAATLASIRADPEARLTLEVYPQLLVALTEDPSPTAATVLVELRALAKRERSSRTIEFLEAPFTPVNLDVLNSAGLGGELHSQLTQATRVLKAVLAATPTPGVYLSTTPIDDASLRNLAREHIARVVIPETGLPVVGSMSGTSPVSLIPSAARSSGARAPLLSAIVADSALATHFASDVDPVLAAHRFFAELAQIYFEEPFGRQARGVVVAPAALPRSSEFLSDVLAGLESSPIAEQTTVTSVFSAVPVGADGAPSRVLAVPDHATSPSLFTSSLQSAFSMITALDSILPSDAAFRARVEDVVLLAETSGLTRTAWVRYAAAPLAAVGQIERAISLAGARTVTLTQRRAKVPLTIVSVFPSPIHAILEFSSSTLAIAPRDVTRPVVLAHKNSPFELPVTARTSGVSTLTIELVSPRGGILLFEDVYTVRSTAFSIVAVGLSVGALLVLALWWLRSHFRRKRRRARLAGTELSPANHE
ncbi:MAG: DUF6049 family protein [Acidimicrobiales bacterium]